MNKNVVVVGGGIAGLASAIYLARGGRTVTVFEKRRYLGGRAVTHLRHGFRFNLGPHAFYRAGYGAGVLRELGIPIRGGSPRGSGFALDGGERYRFPANLLSLLVSGLIPAKGKLEAAKHLFLIRRMKRFPDSAMPFRAWLDANVANADVRRLIAAVVRLASYSDTPEELGAVAALRQVRIALRGVTYIDEGWQKIVDGLHSAAVSSGVNFVTSSRVVAVDHDGARVRGISLGGLDLDEDSDETLGRAPRPLVAEMGCRRASPQSPWRASMSRFRSCPSRRLPSPSASTSRCTSRCTRSGRSSRPKGGHSFTSPATAAGKPPGWKTCSMTCSPDGARSPCIGASFRP